ncbi:MAG: creatininase family protein, partial [Candidatus Thermoplasmatota archaeon]
NSMLILEEMSYKKIDSLPRDKTMFFQPISPMEVHGPHLPVGTDMLIARDVAKEAIKKLNRIREDLSFVLMPTLPVGYAKLGSDFPGSIGTDSRVIRGIVYDTCSSLGRFGFIYIIICTYHMELGHLKGIYQGIEKAKKRYNMKIYEPWSPYFYNKIVEKHEPKLGFDTYNETHACFRETSVMKYQYPYLVDPSYKDLKDVYVNLSSPLNIGKTFKELGSTEGYIGAPSKADTDYGRWFFEETVNVFVNAALDLYDGKPLLDLPLSTRAAIKSLFWI